jgi:hypothetical protein
MSDVTLTDQQVVNIVTALLDFTGFASSHYVEEVRDEMMIADSTSIVALPALAPIVTRYLDIARANECGVICEGGLRCGIQRPCSRHS